MKSFYEYDANNPAERRERDAYYPELSKFHMALQDELPDEEYETYFEIEKQLASPQSVTTSVKIPWIR